MMAGQRDTLAVLKAGLRSEAHVIERWPHLLAQQLQHYCARRGDAAAPERAMLEQYLDGRQWIRRATFFGRPASAGQLALGRGRDIVAARLTHDGRAIVAIAAATCTVWSTASGEMISELPLNGAPASALALAPGGNVVAIGHRDGCCSIWDLAAGSLVHQWQAHDQAIEAVAVCDSPRLVATFAGTELVKTLRIWESPSNRLVRERHIEDRRIIESMAPRLMQSGTGILKAVAQAVRCVGLVFLDPPDAVLCAQPGAAEVWNWSSGETVWRAERAPQWWAGGSVSYEDAIIAAHALEGTGAFVVVDASGGVHGPDRADTARPNLRSVAKAAFSRDSLTYLAANTRHECRLGWLSPEGWHERPIDLGGADAFDLSGDGRFVIATSEDRCTLFEVSDIKGLSSRLEIDGDVTGCAFAAGGAACTVSGYGDIVHVAIESSTLLWRASLAEGAVSGVSRASGGALAAASSRNGALLVVDDRSPQDAKVLRADGHELTCVAVLAGGERIAAGSGSGAVVIWESPASERHLTIPVFEGAVTALSWISATTVAVAGEATGIRVVDVTRPRRQGTLNGHEAWVTCLSGLADRGLLLSGGLDGRICLWNPGQSMEPIAVWRDRIEPARVAWLPASRLMASVDARGLFRLRSEAGEDHGLCVLEGAAVALECLDENRLGYVNVSGEVTILGCQGSSRVQQPAPPPSKRSGIGALWQRWTKE